MTRLLAVLTFAIATVTANAQNVAALRGRVLDGTGRGVVAGITARDAADSASVGTGRAGADGEFLVLLSRLPARVLVEARLDSGRSVRLTLDSAMVRASNALPVVLRLGQSQELARVVVRVQAQKRPSVFTYFEGEASTRTDQVGGGTTDWLDPFAVGTVDALLRASPDMLVLAGGGTSLLGAPSTSNQVQLGSMRVPSEFVSGALGGTVSTSPWDVTIGGVAGANANVFIGPGGRYVSSYATLRSGAATVPRWLSSSDASDGVVFPAQLSGGSSGPIGNVRYRANGFVGTESRTPARWSDGLDAVTRGVVDSVSRLVGSNTLLGQVRSTKAGIAGRLDLLPSDQKRVDALTIAASRTDDRSGGALYQTASVTDHRVADVGLLQYEHTRVLHERVLWSSVASASADAGRTEQSVVAPTLLLLTPTQGGGAIVAGGSAPIPNSGHVSVDGKSTTTWYSVDNARRFVLQLEARGEQATQGARRAHGTFFADVNPALSPIAFSNDAGARSGRASVLLVSPAASVRQDLNKQTSLLAGLRADGWATSGLSGFDGRGVDVSPRVSVLLRIPRATASQGNLATIRAGVGRFVDWPSLDQWRETWQSAGTSRSGCATPNVPTLDLLHDTALCPSASATQVLGRTVASSDLRPTAATRADLSIAMNGPVPTTRAELGVATSRTDRIATRRSPLVGRVAVDRLSGEDGRAMLTAIAGVRSDGTVAPAITANAVTTLAPDGWSDALQLRARLATKDPFATFQFDVRYTLTLGQEHTLVSSSRDQGMGILTGPLSAGGRHTVVASAGWWLGDVQVRASAIARSGIRFTPLADRDLNGDGLANDAAFIPQEVSSEWEAVVPSYLRSCIAKNSGHVAAYNSCTGPWSIQSQLVASVAGTYLGFARGTVIDIQISNPLGALFGSARAGAVTFGDVAPVNAVLEHIAGFDAGLQRFRGTALTDFGTSRGLPQGIIAPVRLAVGVRVPLGPSVTAQRSDDLARTLSRDSSPRAMQGASMQYFSDLPPIPFILLQSGDGLQLTGAQRTALQALGGRWQQSVSKVVGDAVRPVAEGGAPQLTHQRLADARVRFLDEVQAIAAEIRRLLAPDQIDELPDGIKMMLNPRFLRNIAAFDASM